MLGTIAVLGSSCSFKFTFIVVLPTVIFIFSTLPSFICFIKSVYEIWSSGITSSSFLSFITVYTTVPNITNDNATIIIHSNTFLFLSLSFLLFLFFVFSLFLLSFNFITSKPILIHCFLLVYLQFLDFLVPLVFSLFLFVFLFHVCF